jgi:hypothetical protein
MCAVTHHRENPKHEIRNPKQARMTKAHDMSLPAAQRRSNLPSQDGDGFASLAMTCRAGGNVDVICVSVL